MPTREELRREKQRQSRRAAILTNKASFLTNQELRFKIQNIERTIHSPDNGLYRDFIWYMNNGLSLEDIRRHYLAALDWAEGVK